MVKRIVDLFSYSHSREQAWHIIDQSLILLIINLDVGYSCSGLLIFRASSALRATLRCSLQNSHSTIDDTIKPATESLTLVFKPRRAPTRPKAPPTSSPPPNAWAAHGSVRILPRDRSDHRIVASASPIEGAIEQPRDSLGKTMTQPEYPFDLSLLDDPLPESLIATSNTTTTTTTPADTAECAYCQTTSSDSLVKCLVCLKYFCNASQPSGSHIIHHLVRAKHKQVQLHPLSALGDTTLECYNCGHRNPFLLGFIPAKQETVVVLLCRTPCAQAGQDANWDVSQWTPLIANRSFLPWLVSQTPQLTTKISLAQISRLEDLWRDNQNATLQDLSNKGTEEVVQSVTLRYTDAYAYQNIFAPLVKMDADYDKKMKEAMSQDVTVRWELGINSKRIAYFSLIRQELGEMRLVPGDELVLRYKGELLTNWEARGQVIKVPDCIPN